MTDPGIDIHLELTRHANGVEVRAYVHSAPPRPLRWRLDTIARGSGGTSTVAQSGTISGGSSRPLSVTGLSSDSQGTVVLTIFDGDRPLAHEQMTIETEPSSDD